MLISRKRFGKITPVQNSIYFVTSSAVHASVAVPVAVATTSFIRPAAAGNGTQVTRLAATTTMKLNESRRRRSIISEPKEPPISEQ